MTDKQPEALLYADKLDKVFGLSEYADEIRRLHQSEREGWRYADELEQERKRLHEEIEALRTALAQPKKEWVGLTDEEYELMAEKRVTNYFFNTLDYAHDIEAKLKEKNT